MLGEISEGFEETISNSLETAFTDISISINKNYIYDIKETLAGKEFKLFQIHLEVDLVKNQKNHF